MANELLDDRDTLPVGKHWAFNFHKRQPELKMRRFSRYDYQRAKCDDPEFIQAWLMLVQNIVATYGIVESNIRDFDETGFMMRIILAGMIVTGAKRRSNEKNLAQPGNQEWGQIIIHQIALLRSENQILQQKNEILSRHRRAKKKRLRNGGCLTVTKGQDLQDQKDVNVQ
ncbi:hypothetical protein HOO65_070547 [Ceratocystis lukuohia]|uniref:Transposase n=1 Tax=Ceratocystis lukuohia TaxID=2019550 RepID=A0ABR4MCU2_9PEZI